MKTIFGLFDSRGSAETAATFARRSNVPERFIRLFDSTSPEQDLVEPSPRPRVWKGIRSFTILGTLIFAVFGSFAAVGSVTSTSAPTSFAVQVLAVFLIIGFLSGMGMGFVKGRSDAEQEIQAFREAFESGKVMLVVETDPHAKAMVEEMRRAGGQMIFVCKDSRPMPAAAVEATHAVAAH